MKPFNANLMPYVGKKGRRVEYEEDERYSNENDFENLRCPSCVLNSFAQTYKFRGIPWCDFRVNYKHNYDEPMEGLSAELEQFYQFVRPKTEDDVLRKATYYCIAKSIKRAYRFQVEAVKYYGSFSSGTYLPVSDIDLVVFCPNPCPNVVAILFDIAYLLFEDGIIDKHCSIIPHSRIPLIKFYDSMTGFQINITINTPYVMDRADYVRENFRNDKYKMMILYFMKFFLLHKQLNIVYQGGIGSYALSLMVIRYFQEEETQELIKAYEKTKTLPGRLLIGFLQRFSDLEFVRNHIISVRDGGDYIPNHASDERYTAPPFLKKSILYIEDHIEPWRNVANGSYHSDYILAQFGNLLHSLTTFQEYENDSMSILGSGIVVVDSFVDFRAILARVFEEYFSNIPPGSKVPHEKYEAYINSRLANRPKRFIDFDYKKFDDNTAELILKDRLDPSIRFNESNSNFARFFGGFGYKWPGYPPVIPHNVFYVQLHNYHHHHKGRRDSKQHQQHSPVVRQHYPNDSASQSSHTRNYSNGGGSNSSRKPQKQKQQKHGHF